jgi:transposase
VLADRCAGLDVHKDQVTVSVRRWGSRRRRESETRTFLTFAASSRELRLWLEREEVSEVAMEATGVYWKPVWYELEDAARFELMLVNPQHVKAVSGRKTDVRDAAWLAKLLECGLLAGSFVPPKAVRELRDVTRYRRRGAEDRAARRSGCRSCSRTSSSGTSSTTKSPTTRWGLATSLASTTPPDDDATSSTNSNSSDSPSPSNQPPDLGTRDPSTS